MRQLSAVDTGKQQLARALSTSAPYRRLTEIKAPPVRRAPPRIDYISTVAAQRKSTHSSVRDAISTGTYPDP